ncbi:amidase [Pseudobacteriovorax antillogorgiicola]|uniref:Amidase n=1 Tax=Pseudobacteriovorax antillogorgiicola TaxID=1513793 RepID=A0A1Y6CEZ1_9BACT|nr:amidase family protein [Pseudobacteriovorax antillogorgiicola]TCS47610.1 amidase [Pseudobacteriovorax antillogorgiicola]SMF60087.1 amidase [Pseudobacteriovorax antillogorgiicola]
MDFLKLDAIGQAEAIRNGDLDPKELMAAVLAVIEAKNPTINAVCSVAMETAWEKSSQRLQGPFAGVPFLIKDLLPYPGMRNSFGSRLFASHMATEAPDYVSAIDQSGLICIGKTAASEFGLLGSTESILEGVCKNPLDLSRSPGGSSGGAAAAVASGMVAMAHASDGGGSIRIPASHCGLFGFKPSHGRSRSALMAPEPYPIPLLVDHCISRTVRDSAQFLAITENTSKSRIYAPIGYVSGPRKIQYTIGYYLDDTSGNPAPMDAQRVLKETISRCRDLGHKLVELPSPKVDAEMLGEAFFAFAGSAIDNISQMMAPFLPSPIDDKLLEPFTLWVMNKFQGTSSERLVTLAKILKETHIMMTGFLQQVDMVLSPTQPGEARPIGYLSPDLDPELLMTRTQSLAGFTVLYNIAGAPAMSLPIGVGSSGLPIGSQFASSAGRDEDLLNLAYQLLT